MEVPVSFPGFHAYLSLLSLGRRNAGPVSALSGDRDKLREAETR